MKKISSLKLSKSQHICREVRVGCCCGFGFREGGGGVDLGLGSVRVGCCRGFGFRGNGLLPWVWVP